MDRLRKLFAKAASGHDTSWTLDGHNLRIQLEERSRHQDIRIDRDGDDYVFTSVVLSARDVTRSTKRWCQLARLAWIRNAQHEVVTFGFDDDDRLVGLIRHPAAFLDAEELTLYIQALSRECDRFEYLLTGADVY